MFWTKIYSKAARLQRTIRTVQKEIGIEAYRKQGTWYWHMPEPEEEVDEE